MDRGAWKCQIGETECTLCGQSPTPPPDCLTVYFHHSIHSAPCTINTLCTISVCVSVFGLFISFFLSAVPGQPTGFEAEAELDSRIMLSWLWPVKDPIISFELLYWEANNPTEKESTTLRPLPFHKNFPHSMNTISLSRARGSKCCPCTTLTPSFPWYGSWTYAKNIMPCGLHLEINK